MKIIIFGATGSIGRHLVDQALMHGHNVTAFARNPAALTQDHPNLKRFAGDALDAAAVDDAVQGHDAVLVALGAGRKGGIRSAGTKNVIDGMQRHGVRRLVCETTLGAGDSRAVLNFFWKRLMFGLLLRPAFADHQLQEAHIRDSDLDWVIVRPAAFTDGPATNVYKEGFPATEQNLTFKISRADVAGFMLRQIADNTYLRQTPGLSYAKPVTARRRAGGLCRGSCRRISRQS
jgi:putative NADH-flavin reductase